MTENIIQAGENSESTDNCLPCPVCDRIFNSKEIEDHVNKCLFLNTTNEKNVKRRSSSHVEHIEKKLKRSRSTAIQPPGKMNVQDEESSQASHPKVKYQTTPSPDEKIFRNELKQPKTFNKAVPLAEQVRPTTLEDYVGQSHVLGKNKLLRSLLDKKDIPSMILWGPPGCGKTTLANIIACMCKNVDNIRFVKLSATMSGINDVKEVVNVAKNELKFKRRTILFMDEIHRFNKLQQDTFLPHVENGTISLVGATTENPSFSLNNALLSRCRVIVLEKLSSEELLAILVKALEKQGEALIVDPDLRSDTPDVNIPRVIIEKSSLQWLADISDGDARVALSSLQLALQSKDPGDTFDVSGPGMITLDDIKDGIKRSHLLYDRKGEEHYNIISALHKSIRASDDNAALYWVTRMLEGGEDPIFIARRLVRAAGEDIGLADPKALQLAVSCLHGCQAIGMPECDVILAECAVYLARAPKSQEVYRGLLQCKKIIKDCQGPLPAVPLHLRNAPTKLMKQLGYGKDYNMRHKDESNLQYMPAGMENVNFF